MSDAFIEEDCTFTFEGRTFTSGGAVLLPDENGLLHGTLYMRTIQPAMLWRHEWEGGVYTIGEWHSEGKHVPCSVSRSWHNNMGDRRRFVTFEWEGHSMYGVWCYSAQDCVHVHERKGGKK